MKRIVKSAVLLLLLCIFTVNVQAETTKEYIAQQLEAGGANGLWERLDAQTREMFERVGVEELSDLMHAGVDVAGMMDIAGKLLSEQGRTPFAVTGMLLAAVVLCAYVGGLKDSLGNTDVHTVYQTVCTLAISTVVTVPFFRCVQAVNDALSGVTVFMGSFTPVYVATLAASGNLSAALSYNTVLLTVAQLLGFLTDGVLLPLLTAALALGIVTAVSDGGKIGKLGEMLLKTVTWTLGMIAALFVSVLTVNGVLGAAGDGLGNRIARLSISGMVPVVGGALSEAFLTVKGCIGVVRTTIGAFGIFSTLLLLLPCFIRCVCWQLCLWLCATVAEVFDIGSVSSLLKTMQQVAKNMIAILSVSALFMTIATVVVARGTV